MASLIRLRLRPSRPPFPTVWFAIAMMVTLTVASGLWTSQRRASAVDAFEQPPISYSASTPNNVVSQLDQRLAAGEAALAYDESVGYLRSVLAALDVPIDSQTLVFSKTSLQQQRISPKNPRALYFNDDVYVGFVRSGEVLEVSVADPALGTVFYTLDQVEADRPAFVRQTDSCLLCHGGSQTRGVPGHIVRSVYPDRSGQPIFSAGSHRVDHTTPLADRWGGWYVSGRHGDATHLGNIAYRGRPSRDDPADTSGLNQTDLNAHFRTDGYLTPDSDLVALSVLAHQASAHTLLTSVAFNTRSALYREEGLNRDLGEPEGTRWPSTESVLNSAVDSLLECFLLCDEPPLAAPISGTSTFGETFAASGPHDAQGRSLKALDLNTRLFRYPCSYLIYTASFDALPEEVRQRFWTKLDAVLAGDDPEGRFTHLSPADRTAIREILASTKPGVPWHAD